MTPDHLQYLVEDDWNDIIENQAPPGVSITDVVVSNIITALNQALRRNKQAAMTAMNGGIQFLGATAPANIDPMVMSLDHNHASTTSDVSLASIAPALALTEVYTQAPPFLHASSGNLGIEIDSLVGAHRTPQSVQQQPQQQQQQHQHQHQQQQPSSAYRGMSTLTTSRRIITAGQPQIYHLVIEMPEHSRTLDILPLIQTCRLNEAQYVGQQSVLDSVASKSMITLRLVSIELIRDAHYSVPAVQPPNSEDASVPPVVDTTPPSALFLCLNDYVSTFIISQVDDGKLLGTFAEAHIIQPHHHTASGGGHRQSHYSTAATAAHAATLHATSYGNGTGGSSLREQQQAKIKYEFLSTPKTMHLSSMPHTITLRAIQRNGEPISVPPAYQFRIVLEIALAITVHL